MSQDAYRVANRYAAAIASVALATFARVLLDPVLGIRFPFATLFFAVVFSAWFGGFGPALLASLLGVLTSAVWLLEPYGALSVDPQSQFGLLLYAAVSVGIAILGGGMQRARIRAEESAVESHAQGEQLRVTLESIGDAVVVTDTDGMITAFNAVAADLTGWSAVEAIGRPVEAVLRLVSEDSREPVTNPVETVLAEGRTVGLANHTILIARDGTERLIDDRAAPIIAVSGEMVGVVMVFRDVTEGRRNRERAQRSEEAQALLAAVVQTSEDAIVTKTLDGVITSWNAGAERLFGFTSAEAIARPITIIYPDERLTEEQSILQRLRSGERVEHFETQRLTKDGRLLDISLAISPLRDGDGRVAGASMVARDITARKRTEQALRESESRFRSLVGNAPAAIFVKDVDGRYTLANPLARLALGSHDDVIGRTDHDLLPADVADELRKRDLEVVANAAAIEAEERVRRPGFDRRYLSVKFPLIGDAGALGVCGVAIDITDRKAAEQALRESEERFRTMADNIAQFAWMTDENGWIFWYNQRWFEYTGTSLEQMVGWGWAAVHHPEHVERVVEKYAACLRSGEVWEDTFPLRGRDGQYRWFLSRAIPIRDQATGKVLHWFGTNTDVTAQREAEEALLLADRRKDTFLATLAHELRNPLAPLRNSIEIMKHGGADGALLARSTTTMDRQLTHLERLVDDLLDIARISRDQIELRREVLDLCGVVEQAVETCRPLADSAGLDLRFDGASEAVFVDGDAVRLAQIFANLLNNACKYTDRGGVVSIDVATDGDAAVVTVRDTGRGIPPEMLGTVFDMFTQLEPASQRVQSGLGIGLTLVRRLVEMHDGTVDARSEGSGRGSEFVVRLPLREAAPMPATRHGDERTKPNGGRRVLVVDDNADAAEALSLLLQLKGHETQIARDGAEAFAAAGEFRPDIALLDIGLPVMSGLEVAKRIREQPWGKAMTLVALTGWGQEEDRRKSAESGFDHHLVKPIDVPTLVRILDAAPTGGS